MSVSVLIVENSPVVSKVLKHLLQQTAHFNPILCANYAEAKALLSCGSESFFAAIVDLNLPDSSTEGDIVDLVLEYALPCIVLTDEFNDDLRLGLLNKGVLDYIAKEGRYSFHQAISIIERLRKNQSIKALVAEDSSTSRLFIKALLEQYRFQVLEVENGHEALAVLEKDPSIRLLITDHNMPIVNGYELVRMLRLNKRFQDLVIIGLSAEGDSALSAKFIKMGANDFLKKPFYHEEFHCRVIQNLESQEMLETIRNFADIDPLTQLKNRRYLFAEGQMLFDKLVSDGREVNLVLLDVEKLESINVTYGHMLGDLLLKELGTEILKAFPDVLACRFSGGVFCLVDCEEIGLLKPLNAFLEALKSKRFTDAQLTASFNMGFCRAHDASLEEAINLAEKSLKIAKDSVESHGHVEKLVE